MIDLINMSYEEFAKFSEKLNLIRKADKNKHIDDALIEAAKLIEFEKVLVNE